ncbi:cmc1-like, cytochrome c oxidase biogenesis protein [Histoplasma ohiense]|nr:cmc1-like, cytochrome c oxidase biogenesis protein [Histoplasma ohiense (nom. inval.)]
MTSREKRHLYYRCAIEGGEGVLGYFFFFFIRREKHRVLALWSYMIFDVLLLAPIQLRFPNWYLCRLTLSSKHDWADV